MTLPRILRWRPTTPGVTSPPAAEAKAALLASLRVPTPGDLAQRHTAPASATPAPVRSTYRALYTGSVPVLIAYQVTRAELTARLAAHYTAYTGTACRAVLDVGMPHALLRVGDRTVATATLTILPTGGVR